MKRRENRGKDLQEENEDQSKESEDQPKESERKKTVTVAGLSGN